MSTTDLDLVLQALAKIMHLVFPVHDEPDLARKLVYEEGAWREKEYTKSKEIRHNFHTLDDLVDYVKRREKKAIVTVSQDKILADLEPWKNSVHRAEISLDHAIPFAELVCFDRGDPVSAESLWMSLERELYSYVPSALSLAIGQVEVSSQGTSRVQFGLSGRNRKQEKAVNVFVIETKGNGDETRRTQFQTDWFYEGPIWSCDLNARWKVGFRVIPRVQNGTVLFSVAIQDREKVITESLAAIKERLQSDLGDLAEVYLA